MSECLRADQIEAAASYVLVLTPLMLNQSLTRRLALRVLGAAIQADKLSLARDIFRFWDASRDRTSNASTLNEVNLDFTSVIYHGFIFPADS